MQFDPLPAARVQPLPSSPSLRVALFMLFCAALAVAVPFLSNPTLYALTALMLACFATPIWFSLQRGSIDAFESVHAMGLRFFVYFGIGAIWTWEDPSRVAYDAYIQPYVVPAATVCLLGFLAFLAGYYGPWFRKRPPRSMVEIPTSAWLVIIPGVVGFIGSMALSLWIWASWADVTLSAMLSSLGQLWPVYYFAWALCWMVVFTPTTPAPQRWVLVGLFVPASVVILFSDLTDKSGAFMLAAVPLMAWWYTRGSLPWKALAVLMLVLVFAVFPFANTFRLIDARIETSERITMTTRMISDWDTDRYMRASWGLFKRRLALINSVAVVIRDTPRWVPYAHGDTLFVPAFSYFVPRFVWPDKPAYGLGGEFGQKFHVVGMLDKKSSIAPTVAGELYWNYGTPGVILGMVLWGAWMRGLYRRYGESTVPDPVRRAIHLVLLIQFLHFGGGIAAQTVALVRTLVLLEAYRWIARRTGLLRWGPVSTP